MKSRAILVLFFLSINNVCNAQSLNLGIKYEPFYLQSEVNAKNESTFYYTSFYMFCGIKILSDLEFKIEPGFIISEERYNGFETKFQSKYFFKNNEHYISLGLTLHSNRGGSSHSHRIDSKLMTLLDLTVGTHLSKVLFTEISYQFPVNKSEYGRTLVWNNSGYTYNPIKLIGLFKLGLGLSFDL